MSEHRAARRGISPNTQNAQTLTPAQMHSNFEEWIKMCTDNKVNATNTWNFALIDYFHEMTFIREGDSINFQKASCTLDGCVKIYTSRVDSVASETGKLLSGLADSNNADGDDETRPAGERRVRRKTNRSEATLVKDFSSIAIKKFDLDFTVDPLFKKTSADFDEGGARGLLLNHLSLDQNCKIIFDASDATIKCDLDELDGEQSLMPIDNIEPERAEDASSLGGDDEDNDDDEDGNDNDDSDSDKDSSDIDENNDKTDELKEAEKEDDRQKENAEVDDPMEDIQTDQAKEASPQADEESAKTESKEPRVEIYRLKAKLPDFNALPEFHIVPFLKGFDFFDQDDDAAMPDLDLREDEENDKMAEQQTDIAPDAFHFDDNDIDFGGMDDMDPFEDGADDNHYGDNDRSRAGSYESHEVEPDMPKHHEHDFLSALISTGEQDILNYFDSTLSKNWAGPEHWKLRRPVEKKAATTTQNEDDQVEKPKRSRKAAECPLSFDELLEMDEEEDDGTFESSHRKPVLSKDALSKMEDNLLPDDIQFTSKLLLQYALKPMFTSGKKKKKTPAQIVTAAPATDELPADNGDNPDINFWADQNQDDYGDIGVDYGDDDMQTDGFDYSANDPTAYSGLDYPSLYNDSYEDPEVSILYGDELITNHHLKKTRPMYVNYARTAKRVDVKKLKDNLWKVLTSNDSEEEKVEGVQKFTDIINHLKQLYPPKIMKDISVPFCFICLLHLANEKDLSISGVEQDDFVLGESNDWMNNESVLNEITIVQN